MLFRSKTTVANVTYLVMINLKILIHQCLLFFFFFNAVRRLFSNHNLSIHQKTLLHIYSCFESSRWVKHVTYRIRNKRRWKRAEWIKVLNGVIRRSYLIRISNCKWTIMKLPYTFFMKKTTCIKSLKQLKYVWFDFLTTSIRII